MITLGALVLPSGLWWSDEFDWTPIVQATDYGLTGALFLQEGVKQSGRPVTLKGQRDGNYETAWIARGQSLMAASSLEALRAALCVASAAFTLSLHDGRTFRVAPRHDGEGPLKVAPLPAFKSFAPASTTAGMLYFVDEIRLLEIPI